MHLISCLFLIVCLTIGTVFCNVEKTIFTAPERQLFPDDASIANLLLVSLNPNHLSVRTYVNASFPTETQPKGTQTWLLLEDLHPGRRYEVRICWLATQPTAFWLYTHPISKTFDSPPLISSLSSYAYVRHSLLSDNHIQSLQNRRPKYNDQQYNSSMLFLQIHVMADYYSLNESLMKHVPPVLVDIILDPYILNIFPQSLVPTAIYITCIAIGAWFLTGWIVMKLRQLPSDSATTLSAPTPEAESKKSR